MEYIASGAQADIYKDGNKAVKLLKYNINKEDIEYEINLQKIAFDYGLPVPKIFGIINIDDKLGIEMEYLEGKTIGNIIFEDMSKNEIHEIIPQNITPMKNRLKYHIKNVELLSLNERESILLNLEQKYFDRNLCHGNFHIMNLIQLLMELK